MSPCSSLMSVPPIPTQPPSPPPAAQLPPSMPLSRPPKMTTARAMTTRVANNLDSGPSLIETHPNCEKWPEWIAPCVKALEWMCEGPLWEQTISDWLELEDMLRYPKGKVRTLTYILDTVTDLNPRQRERKTLLVARTSRRQSANGSNDIVTSLTCLM